MPIFKRLCGKQNFQKTGVCNISKTNSHLENCYFCGKLYAEQFTQRKRKDPQDSRKFCRICDICNQAYLDRQMLAPFVSQSNKLRKIVDQREGDYTVLSGIYDEVSKQINHKSNKVFDS